MSRVRIPTIDDLLAAPGGVRGARVLVRSDLNVPLRDGRVSDDTRLRAALPTLRRLLAAGARVVLCSHLGRPKGSPRSELSLRPVAEALSGLLGRKLGFCPSSVGAEALSAAEALGDGELLLLENLRFDSREEANDPAFAKALAELADVYVNDAFGTAHRAHASTAGVAAEIPRRAAGDLMRAELRHLLAVREPKRPLLCFLGGAKVSDKLAVLEALAPHADVLAIGGAMAYTFLRARGEATGNSLVEEDRIADAARVVAAAERADRRLLLPSDHIVVERIEPDAPTRAVTEIPDGAIAVDIGPETAERYARETRSAKTIFWNGPMGIFEMPAFARGTLAVARAVAVAPGHTVVGGGDSLAAINQAGVGGEIDHLSTGGGASLEYIQGLALPGVTALTENR
ncbi:MAG: phosphoglycerate kinase [Myxococcales bacterium]|nr:phosphoglycerate kinase [Myxococcales bacterium]